MKQKVLKHESESGQALAAMHNLINSYKSKFIGLQGSYIGIFPDGTLYPAVSVNPKLDRFGGWLNRDTRGKRYYVIREYEVSFWVDSLTRTPERILSVYAHTFSELMRHFKEFYLYDANNRKQSFNYETGNVIIDRDVDLTSGKRGHRISVPVTIESKNYVDMINVDQIKKYKRWESEEDLMMFVFNNLKSYDRTLFNNVKEFLRSDSFPSRNGTSIRTEIDNSALDRFQTSFDDANLAMDLQVWQPLRFGAEALFELCSTTDVVVNLMLMDSNLGGYASNSFWQSTVYSIAENERKKPYFRSSTIWMAKMPEFIEQNVSLL